MDEKYKDLDSPDTQIAKEIKRQIEAFVKQPMTAPDDSEELSEAQNNYVKFSKTIQEIISEYEIPEKPKNPDKADIFRGQPIKGTYGGAEQEFYSPDCLYELVKYLSITWLNAISYNADFNKKYLAL